MPSLLVHTLGCKVNQYESEYLRQGLAQCGYWEVAPAEKPDLCIVNTCAVTMEAEAKSRKFIRRVAQQFPQTEIVVVGCYATRNPSEVAALPRVVAVVGDKRQLPGLLRDLGLCHPPEGIAWFGCRRRAYVKVQDGCHAGCSYCVVPQVRPVLWSRPRKEVVDEVRRLVDGGHREIVLTGIHLGHYGRNETVDDLHRPSVRLADLVEAVARLPGDFRIRLSSIEAGEASDQLLDLWQQYAGRLCPHFHLPLQSGSDAVLRRMRRPLNASQFLECCLRIRAKLGHVALTTDVIVGFPGETEDDFSATCALVETIGFAQIHVFRFSRRPGTPAAEMPGQVLDRQKNRRAETLEQLGCQLRYRFLESLIGKPLQILIESAVSATPEWVEGTSAEHAVVFVRGNLGKLRGKLVVAEARAIRDGRLWAGECQASPSA